MGQLAAESLMDFDALNLDAKVEFGFPIEGFTWHLQCSVAQVLEASTSVSS